MIPINAISLAGLPGLPMQALFDIFLQVFLVNLRIGAFLISAPFFWLAYGAFANQNCFLDWAWAVYHEPDRGA